MPHQSRSRTSSGRPGPLLTPGAGCFAAPGVWVLSLTGRPVHCVAPAGRPGEAPPPMQVAASLESELERMEQTGLPREVVIGADVDPVLSPADWGEALLAAADPLLERGVGIRLCTRGAVWSGAWHEVLRRAAAGGGALLEVGLFAVDPELSSLYEPGAPPAKERLMAAAALGEEGVRLEARIHPLLPWISDTAEHLEALLRLAKSAGVLRAHATYLHIDAAARKGLSKLPPAHRALLRGCLRGSPHRAGGEWLLPSPLRVEGYRRLHRVARSLGMTVNACREANPDLAAARPCIGSPARAGECAEDGSAGRGQPRTEAPARPRGPRAPHARQLKLL